MAVMGTTCDRCGEATETALDISCFSYLCELCWSTGRHACSECETALTCCGCQTGCTTCALSPVGLDTPA
jgi:hypothetical protein